MVNRMEILQVEDKPHNLELILRALRKEIRALFTSPPTVLGGVAPYRRPSRKAYPSLITAPLATSLLLSV
jgi:hypothetical protein